MSHERGNQAHESFLAVSDDNGFSGRQSATGLPVAIWFLMIGHATASAPQRDDSERFLYARPHLPVFLYRELFVS